MEARFFSDWLQDLRERYGLRVEDLASLLGVSASRAYQLLSPGQCSPGVAYRAEKAFPAARVPASLVRVKQL